MASLLLDQSSCGAQFPLAGNFLKGHFSALRERELLYPFTRELMAPVASLKFLGRGASADGAFELRPRLA